MKKLNWNMKKCGDVAQRIQTNSITWIGSGKLMYSVVIIVNNTVLYIWKLQWWLHAVMEGLTTKNCCLVTKSLQSCLTLWDPTGHSLPGLSVHGILQARILEWVAMPSSRGPTPPRDQPKSVKSPALAGSCWSLAIPRNLLITAMVVIILQHIIVSGQCLGQFKLTQCYMSITSNKPGEKQSMKHIVQCPACMVHLPNKY